MSTEGEYKSLAHGTCELLWLQSLLFVLDIFLSKPSILYCDNLGASYLSINSIMHCYTKHVDIDDHFVRDRAKQKVYEFVFSQARTNWLISLQSSYQPRFSTIRSSLTVLPNPLSSHGNINNTCIAQDKLSHATH